MQDQDGQNNNINERLEEKNKSCQALLPLTKSNSIFGNSKKKINQTIRPVVLYASEIYSLLRKDEIKIATWERKIL